MRIKDASSLIDLEKSSLKSSPLKIDSSNIFAAKFNSRVNEMNSYEQEVEELRKEIELAGDKLEKEPILENFRQFRDLLSRLAKLITAEAYQLEKVGGTPHNPRYFEIITIINSEADRLYNIVIHEQRDHMAITAKVIGIKGLVVDLIT